jgi:cytosine/creatinine deaminase
VTPRPSAPGPGSVGGLLLRSVTLADGSVADVRCAGGTIAAVGPSVPAEPGDDVRDLSGWSLVPAPAEPHAHLDKALSADRVPNPSGDLAGAIAAWTAYRPQLTFDGVVERAERAARRLLGNGCTAIRTHVDVADDVQVMCVDALAEVRRRLDGELDLQIVSLLAPWADWRLLRRAAAAGADVIGGVPHLAADPAAMQQFCLETAGELGCAVDLHTDEHLDVGGLDVRSLADWVRRTGFAHGVTASHCVSLGQQTPAVQQAVAEEIAAAGVAVVTLPQTNLYLQGRDHPMATPRALTAIRPLLRAGATVAAGADNLQDPFNLVGRADPLETAALLVMAGHLLPHEAYALVSSGARAAMGLPTVTVTAGAPAELVAVRSPTLRAAIADAPGERLVIHRGRPVVAPRPTATER